MGASYPRGKRFTGASSKGTLLQLGALTPGCVFDNDGHHRVGSACAGRTTAKESGLFSRKVPQISGPDAHGV